VWTLLPLFQTGYYQNLSFVGRVPDDGLEQVAVDIKSVAG
jgi:hypothetical protein